MASLCKPPCGSKGRGTPSLSAAQSSPLQLEQQCSANRKTLGKLSGSSREAEFFEHATTTHAN